nr:hypothetical protein Iba_chr08eCG5040 [Ipomoea batatas]
MPASIFNSQVAKLASSNALNSKVKTKCLPGRQGRRVMDSELHKKSHPSESANSSSSSSGSAVILAVTAMKLPEVSSSASRSASSSLHVSARGSASGSASSSLHVSAGEGGTYINISSDDWNLSWNID